MSSATIIRFTHVQIEAAHLEVRVNELSGQPSADWLKAVANDDPDVYQAAAAKARHPPHSTPGHSPLGPPVTGVFMAQ